MDNKLICYTIGHSKHSIEQFVELLKPDDINLLIDVRSIPYSRFAPQFNRKTIQSRLDKYNLAYVYMGDVIGGKFEDREFLDQDGRVNYLKAVKSERFQRGIEEVIDKIVSGKKVAVMCAEKDPSNCHRFLLISYELNERGINMIHLMADGRRLNNERLEDMMLKDESKQDYGQLDFFGNNESRKMRIELAIRSRLNRKQK